MPFAATWMGPEVIILREVRQKEKDKCHMIYHVYVESKVQHKGTYLRNSHGYREQTCSCQGGTGRKNWEFGISRCRLLYTGWINNEVLLYSTWNYIQYPVINHNRKEYEGSIYMYSESLFCIPETNTIL